MTADDFEENRRHESAVIDRRYRNHFASKLPAITGSSIWRVVQP
jgi:hypothetical protein